MKKPDPARFMGKRKPKADTLEMKGFSKPQSNQSIPIVENKSKEKKTYESTGVRVYDRSSERTDEREEKRVKTRHAFDIFEDQLLSLHRLQLESVQAGKKKPKLGDMVQKALDDYLDGRENKKGIERTDERPNVRTDEQI